MRPWCNLTLLPQKLSLPITELRNRKCTKFLSFFDIFVAAACRKKIPRRSDGAVGLAVLAASLVARQKSSLGGRWHNAPHGAPSVCFFGCGSGFVGCSPRAWTRTQPRPRRSLNWRRMQPKNAPNITWTRLGVATICE